MKRLFLTTITLTLLTQPVWAYDSGNFFNLINRESCEEVINHGKYLGSVSDPTNHLTDTRLFFKGALYSIVITDEPGTHQDKFLCRKFVPTI